MTHSLIVSRSVSLAFCSDSDETLTASSASFIAMDEEEPGSIELMGSVTTSEPVSALELWS